MSTAHTFLEELIQIAKSESFEVLDVEAEDRRSVGAVEVFSAFKLVRLDQLAEGGGLSHHLCGTRSCATHWSGLITIRIFVMVVDIMWDVHLRVLWLVGTRVFLSRNERMVQSLLRRPSLMGIDL